MLVNRKRIKLIVVLVLVAVAGVIGTYVRNVVTRSEVFLRNGSGDVVVLRSGTIERDVVTEAQGVRLEHGGAVFMWISAPEAEVKLQLEIEGPVGVKRLACDLDNTNRPCFFEVFIRRDGLFCGPCTRNK